MNSELNRTTRRAALAGVIALAGAGCLYSTVRATPPANPDYWPMKKGTTWTLDTTVGPRKMSQVVTVTDVKSSGGASEATLDYRSNGQSVNQEVYRVTATSVTRLTGGPNGGIKMNPPIPIIQYPLTAGKSWNWSGSVVTNGQPVNGTSKFTVSGPETVKTPAGTFKAMRVHSALVMEAQGQKINMPNDYWFAPGVGMVKQSATIQTIKIEGTLTKYKIAK